MKEVHASNWEKDIGKSKCKHGRYPGYCSGCVKEYNKECKKCGQRLQKEGDLYCCPCSPNDMKMVGYMKKGYSKKQIQILEDNKLLWEKTYQEQFGWQFRKNGIDDTSLLNFISSLLQDEANKWGKTIQKMADNQQIIKDEYYKLGEKDGREKVIQIIKDMPIIFPERESDEYDEAYKDAQEYLLNKLNNICISSDQETNTMPKAQNITAKYTIAN